jgi:hypothetical protein
MDLYTQNAVVRDKIQLIASDIGNKITIGPLREFVLIITIGGFLGVFQVVGEDAVPTIVLILAKPNIVALEIG